MPIVVQSKEYANYNGVVKSFYQANVGDSNTYRTRFKESILVQTGADVYFQLDPVNNIIVWTGGNWEDEGFRVGDTVQFVIYDSNGSPIHIWSTLVTSVNGDSLDVNSLAYWVDTAAGQVMQVFVTSGRRESLVLNLNHVANGAVGNEFSSIDSEATRYKFTVATGGTGTVFNGTPVGNQSGQFITSATLKLEAESNGVRIWLLTVQYITSPINQPSLFLTSNCAKLFVKFSWQRLEGEPFSVYTLIQSDDADTGYFDEQFNNGGVVTNLIQGVNVIDYENPTTFSIVATRIASIQGIGASYSSDDEDYYKNQIYSQGNLSMTLKTQLMTVGSVHTSLLNQFGAGYTITCNSITSLGSNQYEYNLTFTPNPSFSTFIDNRQDGDRLFKIWLRTNDTNLLVFNDQLTKVIPIGGDLDMLSNTYLYHNQNYIESTDVTLGAEANIEDDIAFSGVFKIPFGTDCTNLAAKIKAVNSVTNEEFVLSTVNFNFGTIPQISGVYQLNETAPVISILPNTSVKLEAKLYVDDSIVAPEYYGVRIYYPFLYRWETWLDQPNAANDFYPNKNKNWYPYGNTGDWSLELSVELDMDELLYTFKDDLIIKDYDSDDNIDQEIDLIIDSTSQVVGIITEGMLMRVRATHTLLNGEFWEVGTWGMITVEPKESSPRWICSTIVPFDNNVSNPLTPLNGLYCDLQLFANVAIMECYFDPTKVNLENGCKFTTKIKGCSIKSTLGKKKTDGTFKLKTGGVLKLKAI